MIYQNLISELDSATNASELIEVLAKIDSFSTDLTIQQLKSIAKVLNQKIGLKTSFGGNMACDINDKACQIIEDRDSEEKVTFDPTLLTMTSDEQDKLRSMIVQFVELMNFEDDFEESQRAKEADYDS